MTSFADSSRNVSQHIVAMWDALAARCNPYVAIVAACAALTGPLVFFRGYNSDEGLTVSIARTALEHGDWLDQHIFNMRWVDSPRLLAWIIAAISAPFGGVNQITARLPLVLFLLFGCLLIYWLLRRVSASVPAALLGVALFLACPLVIRYDILITADLPLAVTLFFAFYLWWGGNAQGSIGIGRWLAIGGVLAIAGLFKGPQLIAYFAFGIGLYVLVTRSWRQIPGLVLAGVICALPLAGWYAAIYRPGDEATWGTFMRMHPALVFSGPIEGFFRLLGDTLPAALMAAAFLLARRFDGKGDIGPSLARPGFVGALACYAFTAALLILFWPGGSTPRYYFPLVPPLAVFGGLGYDLLRVRRPQIVAPVMVLTAALLVYALIYAAASPFLPLAYRQATIDAERITALVRAAPGPIYRTGDAALNVLPYVPGRIVIATADELANVAGPAWMIVPTDQAVTLAARRPDRLHIVGPVGETEQWRLLRLDP